MTYVLVRVNFQDFETWKIAFTETSPLRKEFGSKGVTVFRNSDNPNQVFVLGEYEDLAHAQQLFRSQEFRDALKRAGVSSPPEISFLEEVMRLSA